jgi:mannitol/fructose-specific phosphotransferase system IIA component (Ntr-type)
MGALAVLFTLGLIGGALLWYRFYAREHMTREGALFHLFERLGRQRDPGLDRELREILKEGGRVGDHDPFAELVAEAKVLDLDEPVEFDTVVWQVSAHLSEEIGMPADRIAEGFLSESRIGLTPISQGVALPHLRLPGVRSFYLVMVRLSSPVEIEIDDDIEHDVDGRVRAVFFLVSPEGKAREHLGMLASLAGRVCEEGFLDDWLAAMNEQELKEAVLHDERFLSLRVGATGPAAALAGQEVREIALVEDALIALVHREGKVVIPKGRTRLSEGDRLTIVGTPESIRELRGHFREDC